MTVNCRRDISKKGDFMRNRSNFQGPSELIHSCYRHESHYQYWSIYSETSAFLKTIVFICNNATRSQPLNNTFCIIYLGCLWTFIFWWNGLFFKKLYIKAFTVIIDHLKDFLFCDIPLKAYIYGSFDLWSFKNGL